MSAKTESRFHAFLRGYLVCALWSSTDQSDESGGEPLDANYDVEDIAFTALLAIARECHDFMQAQAEPLERYASELPPTCGYSQEERAGHDFWLTRNGHGTGFWDRDIPRELGRALSDAAKVYGSCDLYVGDDGRIYAS